jgi:hypothetical protein
MLLSHRFAFATRLGSALLLAASLAACGGGGDSGGSGGGTTPVVVVPPDARNGAYTAYATTGERFTLTVDFDKASYSFGSPQTSVAALNQSGTFAGDSNTSGYVFQGATGTGITTRFRYVDDMIVGSFRFENVVQPFVASRRFVQSNSDAAGSFTVFGINRANGVGDSHIYTLRINANGTLDVCNDNTIFAIANCPALSVLNYTLSRTDDLFKATRVGNTADTFSFRVAKAGSELVYLYGGIDAAAGTRFFRIGLNEARTFGAGTAIGGSTLGEWGSAQYTSTSYSSTGIALDGHAISLAGTLASAGTQGPTNLRILQAGGNAFAMQNTQLGILIGARNGSGAGYMQIGAR